MDTPDQNYHTYHGSLSRPEPFDVDQRYNRAANIPSGEEFNMPSRGSNYCPAVLWRRFRGGSA